MFAPGVPQLMEEFESTDSVLASLVVSIYILGNAFAPMLLAPLSGIHPHHYSLLTQAVFMGH